MLDLLSSTIKFWVDCLLNPINFSSKHCYIYMHKILIFLRYSRSIILISSGLALPIDCCLILRLTAEKFWKTVNISFLNSLSIWMTVALSTTRSYMEPLNWQKMNRFNCTFWMSFYHINSKPFPRYQEL